MEKSLSVRDAKMSSFVLVQNVKASDQKDLFHQRGGEAVQRGLDFVCIQRLLVTFALVLKLVGKQRLLGSHGVQSNLVIVLVPVLPQTVEAVFLVIRLGCADAPDDKRGHHKCRHGRRCEERNAR